MTTVKLPDTIERVLILKPCCLGDVVMATPLAAAIRQVWPESHITWAVDRHSAPGLANNPHVDDTLDASGSYRGAFSVVSYVSLLDAVRRRGFDVAFVPDRSPLMAWLPWLAGIEHRIGLDSAGRGRLHSVRVPVTETQADTKAETELYLDLLRAVGVTATETRPVYRTTEEARRVAERITGGAGADADADGAGDGASGAGADSGADADGAGDGAHASAGADAGAGGESGDAVGGDAALGVDAAVDTGGAGDGLRVALHPAGGVNPGMSLTEKRWPAERFGSLAERLVVDRGAHVFVLGGPDDMALADSVRAAVPNRAQDRITCVAGELTFSESAALVEACNLYVGNDSGMAHIAAGVDTPVVVIFGPTDPRRYGPSPGSGLAVAPDAGAVTRLADARGSDLIESVVVDDVWAAAVELLGRDR